MQSVTCLTTGACLTADPGVVSLILARSHTFVVIDYEIISTVILQCQLQEKVCARTTGLFKLAKEKVWLCELTVLT